MSPRPISRLAPWVLLLLPGAFVLPGPIQTAGLSAQGLPTFYEPGISPDGSEIAFVSGGDIWTVPVTGGAARLLVAHSADESRPLYSPDGRMLAFNTNRNQGLDVYLMELATGDVRRLTHDSGSEELTGWSADSEWVYFTSSGEDVSGMSDVFRVRASGGTPMAVAADRYETEFFAAPSRSEPGVLAISTRGRMAQSQWWRNGHSHIDEAEIWTVREATGSGAVPGYTRVAVGGKNLWPMWGAEGSLVWMSDRTGAENLWSVPAGGGSGENVQLTDFEDGRVLWPSISADGGTIAFERDFGIWTLDVASGAARPVEIRLMGTIEGPSPVLRRETQGWSDIVVSPDGLKWAFTSGGDVWATTLEGEVPATRVTNTAAAEGDVVWTADSRQVVYTSWRSGTPKLYAFDFASGTERQVTTGPGRDGSPVFSPDGGHLAFTRAVDEQRELRVMSWPDGDERRVAVDVTSGPTWSPDGRWLAYGGQTDEFSNVLVVPAVGGTPRQVSFLANASLGSIGWSAEGDYIVYRTSQRTEPGRLVKVDMVPLPPTFDEEKFRELFNQPRDSADAPPGRSPVPTDSVPGAPRAGAGVGAGAATGAAAGAGAAPTPDSIAIEFDGIRRRGSFVNTNFSVGQVLLSPDGETGVATGDGAMHRITFGANGDVDIERMDQAGNPLGFSANGRQLYVSQGGQLRIVPVTGGGQTRTVSTSVAWTEDFDRTKIAAFEQGWGEMRDGFYDPEFHGADWDAVRDRFRPRIEGARTRAEFNRLMNLMLGELNASHLGHSGRTGPPTGGEGAPTAELGLRFDRIAYENDGRFLVTEVVELGPAHIAGIAAGDEIMALDGVALGHDTVLETLLRDKVGRQVLLTVRSGGGGARGVEVLATSGGAERQLIYRNWVESRRAYVDSISGGRLGYVHIASMSEGALDQLVFDLDQQNHARDGVVVDVRANNGGFVNVYALDILTRQNYFTMQGRGSNVRAPSRVQLGQRALLAPTVLVTNQHTLSDGEDFTEGYRELGLGTVVGEPTAGWIIFTGSRGLVDGTSVRMPSTFIRDNRGQNMELNPRPVDVEVERPAGEWYEGRDRQLDRAVEVLLREIDGGR